MSVLDRPALVPVQLGFCPCEGKPHPDGDVVSLWPELSMEGGMAAQGAIAASFDDDGLNQIRLQEKLAEVWIRHGVAEWTFLGDLDEDGQREAIPVTPENIVRALPYAKGGRLVADKADDLYAESVTAPLAEKLSALSKPGPTRSSRPATSPNRASRRMQQKRSSTATTGRVPRGG